MILAYTLLKKQDFAIIKKHQFYFWKNDFYKEKSLIIWILRTKFQFTKKTNFYNFYLRKIFPNQIYLEREIFTTFIFVRFLLKQFSRFFFIKKNFGTWFKPFWNSSLK